MSYSNIADVFRSGCVALQECILTENIPFIKLLIRFVFFYSNNNKQKAHSSKANEMNPEIM